VLGGRAGGEDVLGHDADLVGEVEEVRPAAWSNVIVTLSPAAVTLRRPAPVHSA
jgi:hypothetical protein